VLTAATIPELATALAQRLEQLGAAAGGIRLADGFTAELQRSIDQFSGYAQDGVDPDFHRGEKAIELFFNGAGRPGNDRNPTMYPFDPDGPYHAIILTPGTLDTKGGPVIDACARVVAGDGQPISGLYGAGNCIASPSAQAYWAGGATVGLAITFGRLAGMHAAQAAASR
jgi:succinate dehydrogenase/fumarate reductase flavoprotein subunit